MKGAHLRRTPLRPRLEFALFLLAMCLFGVGIGLAVSNAQAGRVISSDYFHNNDGPPDDSGCRCKPYKDYDDGNPAHTCRKPSFVAGPPAETEVSVPTTASNQQSYTRPAIELMLTMSATWRGPSSAACSRCGRAASVV